jgi:hypothetical protein
LTVFERYRLSPFEECTGVLNKLHVENGQLIALIGKISLVLPLEMEEKMRSHIGKRIAVLHTDIPNKSFLFRVVSDQEKTNSERGA